jgi:hypothetical protein
VENTLVGYSGNWYFAIYNGGINQTTVYSIPQGSSGATVATTRINAIATRVWGMDVSRGLGSNFWMIATGGTGTPLVTPCTYRTYDTSFTSISSTVSPYNALNAMVSWSDKMIGSSFAFNSSNYTDVYTSTNGSITDVSSLLEINGGGAGLYGMSPGSVIKVNGKYVCAVGPSSFCVIGLNF